MKLISLFFLAIGLFYYCTDKKKSIRNNDTYCMKIDTLEQERYQQKGSNYYANKIIPELESKSKISANCQRGYFGYLYLNDTLFNTDIKKWREYFQCK
jgi:hypothetical protein